MIRRRGVYVDLRTIEPDDMDVLYDIAVGSSVAYRWRFRGATPSPREFSERIWQGVLAQFVVTDKSDSDLIGLVTAMNYSAEARTIDLAIMSHWDWLGRGHSIEGLLLMIDEVFMCWDVQHIYARVPEFNFDQFKSLEGRLFHRRGILPDHDFFRGKYWSEYVISATRADWATFTESPAIARLTARWS